MGVSCCQQNQEDEFKQTYIQEENIDMTKATEIKELPEQSEGPTYNDYLRMIEAEEKAITELDNEIEAVEGELEDVEMAVELEEACRLSEIKSVYETLVTTRKAKEVELEVLESKLDDRRGYLRSLKEDEDEQVDREDEDVEDKKIEDPLEFLDNWEGPVPKKNNGKYIIDSSEEYKQKVADATYFIDDKEVA